VSINIKQTKKLPAIRFESAIVIKYLRGLPVARTYILAAQPIVSTVNSQQKKLLLSGSAPDPEAWIIWNQQAVCVTVSSRIGRKSANLDCSCSREARQLLRQLPSAFF
jgi:hypothetical protein